MKKKTFQWWAFVVLLSPVTLAVPFDATSLCAETVYFGDVYRTGSTSDGFPRFLDATITDATTRAWNFGETTQTLNGINVVGVTNAGGSEITIGGTTNNYASGSLNFATDPQVSAKNAISNSGVFTNPGSWSTNITAKPGQRYVVQVLSNPISTSNLRSLDIAFDGNALVDDLDIPTTPYFSVVHEFRVTAGAGGLDLGFSPGAANDGNPYVTALSVTEDDGTWMVSVDINSTHQATGATVSGDHSVRDLKAAGLNTTDDPIGVWDNGSSSANWWNYGDLSATNLIDSEGNLTGVSYSVANQSGTATNWTGNNPNDDLVSDGAYQAGSEPTDLVTTVSGLSPGGQYDVLVYFADDFPSEDVTVNGIDPVDYVDTIAHPGYTDAFDDLAAGDFWYFRSILADGSGQLAIITEGGGSFNTITGFQIIKVPEPSTFVLTGFGLLTLVCVVRQRVRS